MQKMFTAFLCCFIVTNLFAQTQGKVSTYLYANLNQTLKDVTIGNNPWGAGVGLQTFINTKTFFKPAIELTGDLYLMDDKVYRMNTDGTPITTVEAMVNLFAGTAFSATQNLYFSVVGGPSFIHQQILFGIKPSMGFYFSKSKRGIVKISYINIFKRDKQTMQDFSSVSLSFGFKLF